LSGLKESIMPRLPQDPLEYQATLLLYYEEEIMGEALFAGLAQRFPAPRSNRALQLLSLMERCVADHVRPLLDQYGLCPRGDAELHRIGMLEAEQRALSSWEDYLAHIVVDFPVFLDEFAALTRVAPEADRPRLRVFDDHEVAAIAFAKRALRGEPDSTILLTDFIATYRPPSPPLKEARGQSPNPAPASPGES